jgi:hypothetical protein
VNPETDKLPYEEMDKEITLMIGLSVKVILLKERDC